MDIASDWITPTTENGWSNFDSVNWSNVGYMAREGRVYLRGLVHNGQIGQTGTIFTLPAGYRPSRRKLFSCISSSSGISLDPGRVDIVADGRVIALEGSNLYFCLDGISFPTDEGDFTVMSYLL
jgi:hypothetical protein